MNDHASKLKGLLWVTIACCIGMAFVIGISPLVRRIPWAWEKRLASVLQTDTPKQQCPYDPQVNVLFQQVVKRIYPIHQDDTSFSIHVQIIKDPTVNAYAELGGKILVNSGLLQQAESPEEVAGILAHEIGHVYYRHILEATITHMLTAGGINLIFGDSSSTSNWANYFLNISFSRSQEAQADKAGLLRLKNAYVSNLGLTHFFERMEKSGTASHFLSDHPSNQSRMEMIQKFDNQKVTPIMSPEAWAHIKNYCT